jgi:hypothetical protein
VRLTRQYYSVFNVSILHLVENLSVTSETVFLE